MLSERARTILNILVDEYIHTAAPVASEEIARRSPTRVSPATVRNAMSQLTEAGYISRPHISAGGVPSDLGYRHYVESLREPLALPAGLQRQIRRQLSQVNPATEVWVQRCATVLSSITANLAIVTMPRPSVPRLKHIQLVYLEQFLALLIIVLQGTRLMRRLLPLDEPVTQDMLSQAADRLNDSFQGLGWEDIETLPGEFSPLEDRVRRDTALMLREADRFTVPEHYVDGLRRLLQQPEFSQGGKARELVEMLEERVLLEKVLSETPGAGDVAVYIGGENRQEPLRPYGVVVCQYGIPFRASGTICVIGPTRMGYVEAIGGVSFLASLLNQLVAELYGGDSPNTGEETVHDLSQ
ncbi:MAG: heat-inducible transcription repressor HrcA [SAR202 cluster bacterium]|nr:heat-inducible transcription repressor HrcA [SAR202 cluster bacterium]